MLTCEEITKSEAIKTYIIRVDESLGALGFTEHSFAHVMHVAETAGYILHTMGYDERTVELAKIAGYLHDRVNYSVKKSALKINEDKTLVKLKLTVDTKFGSVMEFFEIFMQRMVLCRKAAERLGLQFRLIINEQQLI